MFLHLSRIICESIMKYILPVSNLNEPLLQKENIIKIKRIITLRNIALYYCI